MKIKLVAICHLLCAICFSTSAQGTAFSYQGRLNDSGSPATGIYDVRFTIYDAVTNGNLVAGPLTNSATAVTNGLFVVPLDFGSGVFTGAARWLEVDVRTNGGGAFSTLLPLQPIQPVPYAIMANAGTGQSSPRQSRCTQVAQIQLRQQLHWRSYRERCIGQMEQSGLNCWACVNQCSDNGPSGRNRLHLQRHDRLLDELADIHHVWNE